MLGVVMNGKNRGTGLVIALLMALAVIPLSAQQAQATPALTLTKDIDTSTNVTAGPGTVPGGFEDHWINNDAGDVLDFKLCIVNSGDSAAYNVSLQDRFTQDAITGQGYSSCAIDSVQSPDGMTVYTTSGNLFSSALMLIKPVSAGETACINYHCTIDPTHSPGNPIDNCAQIKNYAQADMGPNLALSEPNHCAKVTLKGVVSIDKQITSSSVLETTPDSNINQGEILDFSIAVVLGEGTYHNFSLTDDHHSIGAITCGSGGFTCSGNVNVVGSTVTVAATTGSTTGSISYVYSDQQSASGTNIATVDSDETAPLTDTTTWTRTDPNPHVVISGVPMAVDPGDVINATFSWSNTGNPMYQCSVVTVLDPALWDTNAANVTLGTNPSGWTFLYDEPSHTITGTFSPTDIPCTDAAFNVGLKVLASATPGSYGITTTFSGNSLPSGHTNPGAGGTFSDDDTMPVTIGAVAFVDATKTVVDLNGGTVQAGDTLEYTVVLTNGAVAVTGVVFADTMPAHTTYVNGSITSSAGTTHVSGATVSVDGFGMAAAAQVTITFRVTVNAGTAAGTIISNQGSVDTNETTPEPTDADGDDSNGDQPTEVVVGGNTGALTATKTVQHKIDADSSGSVTANDTMTYTVTIMNGTNQTVTNVTFADTIPAGLTYVSSTATITPSSGNSINVSGASATAAIASMAPGANVTLKWDVTINAPLINTDGDPSKEVFTNQGSIDSDQTNSRPTDSDGIPGNGNQPTSFTAVASGAGAPEVDLQKTVRLFNDVDGDGLYDPGDTAEYLLVFRNTGSAPATSVVITNQIPTNTTFVTGSVVTSAGIVSSTNPILISVGTVAPGGVVTMTFRVTVNAGVAQGTIVSCQGLASGGNFTDIPSDNDGTPGAPRDPTTFPVDNDADLALVKTSAPNPVAVGGQLTYTLTVTNNGPDRALNAVVTDTLPAGVTFVSAVASQGTCSGTATVTCNLGSLNNGATATVTIVVTTPTIGTVSNTATVTSDISDPVPGNNSDTEDTPVVTGVDLALVKTVSPANPPVGSMLTYTLVATNNGGITATGVVVTDNLPAQVTFQSASSTVGTCSQATGTVTCNIGTLAGGASASITIVVVRNSAASFSNVAAIDGDQTDPVPGNNNGSAGTPPGGNTETCGNCIDDDGDGLVDYEDPDCCTQTVLTITSANIRPKGGGLGKLSTKGQFSDSSFDTGDPRQEGMTVQIRNAAGQLACCTVEASNWRRIIPRHLGFWDSAVTICPPVKDLEFNRRNNKRSRFELRTGHISLADYMQLLGMTLRIGDRCATGSFTPVTKR